MKGEERGGGRRRRRKGEGLPAGLLGEGTDWFCASVEPPPSPLSPASTSPSNGPQRSLGLKQCSHCSERCAPARKVCPSCAHPFLSRQSQSQSQSQSQTQLQLHKQRQQQQLLAIKQQENAATAELGTNEDEPDADPAAGAELDEKEESGESDDGESADASGELPPLLSLAAPAGVDLATAAPAPAVAADSGSLAAASTASTASAGSPVAPARRGRRPNPAVAAARMWQLQQQTIASAAAALRRPMGRPKGWRKSNTPEENWAIVAADAAARGLPPPTYGLGSLKFVSPKIVRRGSIAR